MHIQSFVSINLTHFVPFSSQNAEPIKLFEGKVSTTKPILGDVKDKRKAFGDIVNRLGYVSPSHWWFLFLRKLFHRSSSVLGQGDKQKVNLTGYKDIKPRVDTRWKKAEIPAQKLVRIPSTSSLSSSLSKQPVVQSKLGKIRSWIRPDFFPPFFRAIVEAKIDHRHRNHHRSAEEDHENHNYSWR